MLFLKDRKEAMVIEIAIAKERPNKFIIDVSLFL
jgi:hypothetical protein